MQEKTKRFLPLIIIGVILFVAYLQRREVKGRELYVPPPPPPPPPTPPTPPPPTPPPILPEERQRRRIPAEWVVPPLLAGALLARKSVRERVKERIRKFLERVRERIRRVRRVPGPPVVVGGALIVPEILKRLRRPALPPPKR